MFNLSSPLLPTYPIRRDLPLRAQTPASVIHPFLDGVDGVKGDYTVTNRKRLFSQNAENPTYGDTPTFEPVAVILAAPAAGCASDGCAS